MVEDCEKKRLWDRWLCRLGHALIDLGDNTYALKGQILAKDSVSGELVELEVVDGKLQIAPNVDVEVNLSENIGLLNSAEEEINPATEDKQDDILEALSNVELMLPTPLKADRLAAISTDGGSVAQDGILAADLYNSGSTVITVWFGEAIGVGKAIYLNPGQPWSGWIDNKTDMYYDSSANGGQLDYVLRG